MIFLVITSCVKVLIDTIVVRFGDLGNFYYLSSFDVSKIGYLMKNCGSFQSEIDDLGACGKDKKSLSSGNCVDL